MINLYQIFQRIMFFFLLVVLFLSNLSNLSARPVVIEDYTATWCGFCFGVNKALAKVDLTIDDVIILEFHVNDEFSFDYTNDRSDMYEIMGLPGVMFNGTVKKIGGSSKSDGFFLYNELYNDYVDTISTLKEEMTEDHFELKVHGTIESENIELHASISTDGYPDPINVIFLVVQDNIEFNASNGLSQFNAVVRIHVGTEEMNLSAAQEISISKSSTEYIYEEDLINMRPIVLIQDQATHEILMAVDEFSEEEASVNDWELYHE